FITVSEPPIADPHDGWCGGCRRETCGYPITGDIFPFTFMDGAVPTVINKSDAFLCTINFNNESKSIFFYL
ncbi:MAG: hypothetical protein KZQ70_06585, partial [gamma proteobacterium symbiont of Lucinoma myriamae]|nr:hypothetical protein [gamma proteobacterium symbiont of Lucinoma myriamae]MCU7820093.1 hypothetical protein [gamma proteobacterium symbiont of Lucinoma myriamae]MCU7832187.1 hypothetical protein [gamma proteobacterium symbiont of Lucinoma myriamae]